MATTELPLIVGVDGSESGLRALDWAADEAARRGVPLRVVHASLWERYETMHPSSSAAGRPPDRASAGNIAASAVEHVRRRTPNVPVSGAILPEDAGTALVRESREALAVVTGSHGRGGIAGLLLGSVSLTVAARAACPVVVVRGAAEEADPALPVVLGVSEATVGGAAVEFAFRAAAARGSVLRAVTAWRSQAHGAGAIDHPLIARDTPQAGEEDASRVLSEALRGPADAHPGVEVQRRVVEGPAHRVLLDASADAALLVVGVPPRHRYPGLQLGRTAHALLHHAGCPVAVVPAAHR